MLKKTLKISAIILTIIALALLAYYFLIQSNLLVSGGKKPNFGNLFPFGTISSSTEPFATTTQDTEPNLQTQPFNQVVRLISNEPVAGEMFRTTPAGEVIRYIEKATGHITDVSTYSDAINQVTNTTIPLLQHVYFTENGKGFVAQFTTPLNKISTFYGSLSGTSTSSTSTQPNINTPNQNVSVTPLSSAIASFAVSPDSTHVATVEIAPYGSDIYLSTPNGSQKKKVWSSPLAELTPSFVSDTSIGLTTKPDASVNGMMFAVNTTNGAVNTLLSHIGDINIVPAYKKPYLLVSAGSTIFSYNTTTGTSTPLYIYTFAEKCVWSPKQFIIYCGVANTAVNPGALDSWYKGLISFSDDIWVYNLNTKITHQLVNLKNTAGRDIDVERISINGDGTMLLITNKKDGSLWSVKIEQ